MYLFDQHVEKFLRLARIHALQHPVGEKGGILCGFAVSEIFRGPFSA